MGDLILATHQIRGNESSRISHAYTLACTWW